ncbi:MAG: hypothetical protein AB7P69_19980 [Candidatus Binatia bacterium]
MRGASLSRELLRLFTYLRQNSTIPKRMPLGDEKALVRVAREIGDDWKDAPYYDSAERYMKDLWEGIIWSFIKDCDFPCVVDLAAGHGRNTERLREIAQKIYVVDINEENSQFCWRYSNYFSQKWWDKTGRYCRRRSDPGLSL